MVGVPAFQQPPTTLSGRPAARDAALIKTLPHAPVRVGELVRIRLADVDPGACWQDLPPVSTRRGTGLAR